MDYITCIYLLYWDIEKPYIGQTVNLAGRSKAHINALRRQDHCNYKIQNEYNKLAINPTIDVLEKCSISELNNLEESYIKEFDSINNGLNIISGGYSVGTGVNNPSSKYSEVDLKEVYFLLNDYTKSYRDISIATAIPEDTVKKIAQGVQHKWLHELYPEIYNNIELNRKLRKTNSTCAASQHKQYKKIMSPDGTVYEVTNTLQFSKEHNLRNGNLCSVLLGKRKSVSGWVGV